MAKIVLTLKDGTTIPLMDVLKDIKESMEEIRDDLQHMQDKEKGAH